MMPFHRTRAGRIAGVIAAGTLVFGVSACGDDDVDEVENEVENEVDEVENEVEDELDEVESELDEVESELQNP